MSNYSDSAFDESNKNSSWYKAYSLIKNGSTVLDVGCSSGNFGSVLIQRKNCIVDGVELNHSDVKLARKKLRNVYELNVETDNLSAIPQKAYDVVYFGDVIEHLVSPEESLKKIKPLLKSGGRLIFSIPNMAWIGVRLGLLQGSFEYTETGILDKTHLHYYTQEEVIKVLAHAGFIVNKLDFVEKDYPKELIDKHLLKLGLRADDKFYKLAAATDASAFQFIGSAVMSKGKNVRRKKFGPIDLFETFYKNTLKNHKLEIKMLQKENKLLSERLEHKAKHPVRSLVGDYRRKFRRT